MPRRRLAPVVLFAVLALALGACAEVRLVAYTAKEIVKRTGPAGTEGEYKLGEPYQVDGVWYYPADDPDYDQTGVASWYGEPFHGQRTANGAVYDMNAMTAAHKTLPMPSRVRVTNLKNGRSIVLTVNDRGPYVNERIIDVSRRAAQLLGFYRKGTAIVRIQIVGSEPDKALVAAVDQAPSLPPQARPAVEREPAVEVTVAGVAPDAVVQAATIPQGLYIQAGAYADPENARRTVAQLSRFGEARIFPMTIDGRDIHRVRLGPIKSLHDATALLARVIAAGHTEARLIVY